MAVGAVVLAPSALAGFSVDADRGVSVSVVSDPNAILGIDAETDIGQLKGNDGAVQIATLTNRLGESATVDVQVIDIPGGSNDILRVDPNGANVADGNNVSATVECNRSEKVQGTQDVVFGVSAIGSSVSVTDATFTVSMEIKCNSGNVQPSDPGVTATDLVDNESTQSQSFEYKLNEDMAAGETLSITVVDASKNKRLAYEDNAYTVTPSGSATGQPSGNEYVITFEATQSLSAGDRIEISATVAPGKNANNDSPYTVDFDRGDGYDTKSTSFTVS